MWHSPSGAVGSPRVGEPNKAVTVLSGRDFRRFPVVLENRCRGLLLVEGQTSLNKGTGWEVGMLGVFLPTFA